MTHQTAAILLIGNELLSGKIADENTYYLTQELFKLGIEVRRVVIVPDDREDIISTLRELLRRVDIVFTSGGIGPTHDDVTVEAVALALNRPLALSADLERKARAIFGEKLQAAHLKMATIPEGTQLVESEKTRWPALVVGPVFVFAGVPKLMRRSFNAVRPLLPKSPSRVVATLFVMTDEWTMAPILDEVVAAFPDVQLGSYPVLDNPEYRVRLTLEGTEELVVMQAFDFLKERLPAQDIVRTMSPLM